MQLRQGTTAWLADLPDHPIFRAAEHEETLSGDAPNSATKAGSGATNSRRRTNKMCFRGPDMILAVGNELRIATFVDSKSPSGGSIRQYKTLHTPNVQFEIKQLAMCPGGKMLAIAGTHQVAVIVLPRPSYYKLVNPRVDCKSIQVGQYYHAVSGSSRIAKIGWHPWNDGASSLLVLTSDGMFREYDVSRDAEEPQQSLSFVSPRTRGQYSVEDPSTREAVSFCIGQGNTDWSPLTVFALMKSGDVWAMSPFLPSNALVPSEYVPALECFVAAKRELIEAGTSAFLSSHDLAPTTSIITDEDAIAITNDQQLKYVNALMKQLLKSGALESADKATISLPSSTSSRVNVRPPIILKYPIARQGPFLLQPAPPELGSGDDDIENPAMDIVYLTIDEDDNGVEGDKEKLGVIGIVYQDGKVDICLDTDKVEAKWDLQPSATKTSVSPADLPSLTTYETIDLGITTTLREASPSLLSLLKDNYCHFHIDPLYAGRVYISHSFGVHVIDMRSWMRAISHALTDDDDTRLIEALKSTGGSEVTHLLDTFSAQQKTSAPIASIAVVDNGFINYTLFAVTSQYQAIPIELSLRPVDIRDATPPPGPRASSPAPSGVQKKSLQGLSSGGAEPAYVSLLAKDPFVIPTFPPRVASQLPQAALLASGRSTPTPDALRLFGKRVEGLRSDMRDITAAVNSVQERIELQNREMSRQLAKLAEMTAQIKSASAASSPPKGASDEHDGSIAARVKKVAELQSALVTRLDRVLQRLMDSYSPKLSEFESKWFAELGRMKREIGGDEDDAGDGRSLRSRTELLKYQLAVLRPQMEELTKKEEDRKRTPRRPGSVPVGLGSAQLRSVNRRLAQETKILEAVREQAESLSKWLGKLETSTDV
ncbi:hypothetical protein BS47DRAFT_1348682 [Hydnum rufescens UP504]|uniref:Uncharacterized protein n=1 Tax=Hydnum rufescens UP504 TaxID=1448309 RepID=A0A9P6AQL1_9AGAM|nr:hypothetical protein BS47DRAFT_1348682 [Hydnum rufescens UP504]